MGKKRLFLVMAVLLVAAIAVSCGGNAKSQAAANENADAAEATDGGSLSGLVGDQKPRAEVEYINQPSGDKWMFALGVSGDGTEPMDIAAFRGNGMQGFDMYSLLGQGNSRFTLREAGADEDSGITIYVYPRADSILVTRDGLSAVFKTVEHFETAISGLDPDYTPERYATTAGKDGGKWETLQSGETAYVYPSGIYARSVWVKDNGKLYYVDVSGCRMLNNYAHDGFYAGSDGSWDKTVRCIDHNVLPRNGAVYADDSGKSWVFQMQTDDDGTIHGTAHLDYPKDIDFSEDFQVKSFGNSAYSLYNVKDDFITWHVVVLDEGRTIRVSGAGVTETFRFKD